MEDGGQSFADQVTERVETIRAQLESQHSQRIQEADELLNKRTEAMRKNLTKKLGEGKEQIRQQLQAEHDQDMQRLQTEHEQKIEAIKAQHQAGMDEVKRSGITKAVHLQQQGLAEHAVQPPAPIEDVKRETQVSGAEWQPTDTQIRNLIATNGLLKNIMIGNVKKGIEKEREALVASMNEEQQKILAEKLKDAEVKATTAKEQAVLMEGKRYGVKISMTENRAKAAQAKIEVVQKAATDTPERPVAEVWDIAKDAKPPPAAPQPAPQAVQAGQTTSQTVSFGKPTPIVPVSQTKPPINQGTFGQTGQTTSQTASFGKPTPIVQGSQTRPPTIQGTFGQRTPVQGQLRPPSAQGGSQLGPNSAPLESPGQPQSPQQLAAAANLFAQAIQQGQAPSSASQMQSVQQQPSAMQQGSSLPAKPQTQTGQRHVAGTGPAVARGLQQSGLPVMRGAARGGVSAQQSHIPQGPQGQQNPPPQRGISNIARGRGRGGLGRGGPQPVATKLPQAVPPGQTSPGSATGGLNAGAKQFVPTGNKRAREDGQEGGDTGSGGKRIRGEGAES